MRNLTTRLVLAAGVLGVLVCGAARIDAQKMADNPQLGTWMMNAAKSKADPGPVNKSSMTKIEAVGGGAKHTIDTVGVDGSKRHWEFTTNYDGKDAPITGNSPYGNTVALTRNGNTTHAIYKQDGKMTATQDVVVSADGKSRTTTTKGKDAQGHAVNNVTAYDRQ